MTQRLTNQTPTRRPRRRGLIAVVLALTLVGAIGVSGYIWLRTTSTVQTVGSPTCTEAATTGSSPTPTADLAAICATLDGLTRSWDAGDAEAYGAPFSEHATYTAFTGTVYQGRDDIIDGHAALFDSFLADTRLATHYVSIHLTSTGSAAVLARGDTYEGNTPPAAPSKIQTYMLTRDDNGRWSIDSFHNTQRMPVMERIQFLLEPATRPTNERSGQ